VVLHALAAAAGLVAPALLGRLVQAVSDGTTESYVDTLIVILACALVLQTILTWFARRASFVVSELIFAELREDFMRRVLALPLSTVERAGTGDLVSRTTADVDSLARTIRFAIPETLIAAVTTVLTVAAALWVSPPAALALVAGAPAIVIGTRWYLKRAPQGYLRERAAYATMAGTVGETFDGGLTVESLGLNEHRVRRVDEDLIEAYSAERYTLRLRTFWFPSAEIAYVLPVVAGLLWGGWLVHAGYASIGEVTAVVLYAQQLADPVDRLISWLDEIQVGGASLARLVGIESVPPDRVASGRSPDGDALEARDVRYAYVPGRDVLHGIDLDLRPGERVAVVGPSGAGKSTLGRLLAGIHPPRTGTVEVGGVGLVELPLETLRQEVALITQEQHVFVGTLADNLRLARPSASLPELEAALAAVDAFEWAEALPEGLETTVGAGGEPLTPPQTQQLALARLVLADPHTLVLDEATSLLDPRAARHLERSLAAVLEGRTVVAIAHRLHTAHDADRVAVVEDGLLGELGTHDELLEDGGAYAALWRSWRS
jgi:ABC-type multidrug transport system fused ATPase/permease subunit